MRKARPQLKIAEGQCLRVIAVTAGGSADEVADALIYWAANLPPELWREILFSYRKSKQGGEKS